jgi:hypothetical protein
MMLNYFFLAISVINTTSWPISADIVEIDLAQLKAGVPFYKDLPWRQLTASGKALVFGKIGHNGF